MLIVVFSAIDIEGYRMLEPGYRVTLPAAGEPSRGLLLRSAGEPQQKYGDAKTSEAM